VRQESYTPLVRFDVNLRDCITAILGQAGHSPAEHADLADRETGVRALTAVLEALAGPAAAGRP
jgi:hypothetical protein